MPRKEKPLAPLCWATEEERRNLHERSRKNIRNPKWKRLLRARTLPGEMAGLDLDEIPPGSGEPFDWRSVIRDRANVEAIVAAVDAVHIPEWLNRRRLRLDIDRIIRWYRTLERIGPKQPREELRRGHGSLALYARRIREMFDGEQIGAQLREELAPLFPAYSGQLRARGGNELASSLRVLLAALRRLERKALQGSARTPKSAKKKSRQPSALDWLVGRGLRLVYERWFQQQRPIRVSQSRTITVEADINAPPAGPYIDFALAVLQEDNIKNPDGSSIARGTVYVAVQRAKAAEKHSKARGK